ncbi:helix-turn-helix domain-containing protein [Nocardia sp. NPDC005825]|uniref:helix-turn-helix domain-containing protein n=1 Tax=unclassified Nocardia TaxID=2637762 RepID=UPI003410F315
MTSGKTRPEAAQVTRDAAVAAEPVAAVAVAEQPVVAQAAAAAVSESAAGQPDIKALAERVKARRKEHGWTQADVAKKGGPSAGSISQIERCLIEEPAEDLLAKLDTALEWPSGTADGIVRGLVGAAS